MHWLLPVNAAATFFMTGLIWFVQIVHYPLFAQVGEDGFARYEQLHAARTTWVVAPVMLIEVASAVGLLWVAAVSRWAVWSGLGLLAIVWISTFLLQVPRHAELASGFLPGAHRRLVATNWIRTIAWTVRASLLLWMVAGGGRN